MFKNIFGNNKIQVELTDIQTGKLIGKSAMKPEQLPESFELYTTFTLAEQEWTVVEADPVHSKDFTLSKSLKLKLQKIEKLNPKDILYTLPTISNELPSICENSQFDSFRINFYEDNWRQREFLNKSSFPLVEIEIKGIKNIWDNHNIKVGDDLNAFDNVHVRSTIGLPSLCIDFKKLQEFLGINQIGGAFIERQGFIENGFSITTENTSYLGVVINNQVTELCILKFNDYTINEIEAINRIFKLIHVDWYNMSIINDND